MRKPRKDSLRVRDLTTLRHGDFVSIHDTGSRVVEGTVDGIPWSSEGYGSSHKPDHIRIKISGGRGNPEYKDFKLDDIANSNMPQIYVRS